MSGFQKPAQKVASKERQARAIELRKAGATYQQIADALDYGSISAAASAIDRGLKTAIREAADELITLELERIDAALFAIWPLVKQGNLGAIDRMLRLMERRSRFLGLDAPEKRQLTGADGGPIVITAMTVAPIEGDA